MFTITEENRRWWVVAAMSCLMLLITLDFFGMAVALPRIAEDLGASTATLLWTVNAYLLAFAAPIIAVGRLSDIVGRRKIVLIGAVMFVSASAACGLAPTYQFLIAARVVQGIGGGMIFATALSIVSNAFPDDQRAAGIGMWAGVGTVGSAIGPFVAGVLTQTLSWRYFFFLNLPVGVAGILLTLYAVKESKDETFTGKIDWGGFVAITAGLALLVFGLQEGPALGFGSPMIWGPIAVAVALLIAFVVIESRVADPLVEFGLFKTKQYVGAAICAFLGNWMFGGILFFLTLYLQEVLEKDPIAAGLTFLAFTIPLMIMSPISGRMVTRYGAQQLMSLGMGIIAVGLVFFVMIDAASGMSIVIIGLVLTGFGQGFAFNISNTAGMEAVPSQKAGVASGVLQSARLMGIVIGIAVSGAVFKALENSALLGAFAAAGRRLSAADQSEIKNLLSGSDAAEHRLASFGSLLAGRVEHIVNDAFIQGLHGVMLLMLILAVVGTPLALLGAKRKANRAA